MPPEENATENAFDALGRIELEALAEKPPIRVEMSPLLALVVIGHIQLALRHPENTGPSQKLVRVFLEDLRRQIAEPGSAVDTIVEMGFNPIYDRKGDVSR